MGLFDKMKEKRADKKAEKARQKEIIKEFKANKAESFGDLLLDTTNKCGLKHNWFIFKLFDFADIKSFDVDVKDHIETTTQTKKKHGITRAVVGGVIAGPAGAVVGGMTGKNKGSSTSKTVVDSITINIHMVDNDDVSVTFQSNQEYIANRLINTLNDIIEPSSTTDNLEQLKKLKELLDMNAITQEEFEAKKKVY